MPEEKKDYLTVDTIIGFGKRDVEQEDIDGIEKRIEGEISSSSKFNNLILDLRYVKFMNAKIYDMISEYNAQLAEKGKGLIIRNPHKKIKDIFNDCYPYIEIDYSEDERIISEAIQRFAEKHSYRNITVNNT